MEKEHPSGEFSDKSTLSSLLFDPVYMCFLCFVRDVGVGGLLCAFVRSW